MNLLIDSTYLVIILVSGLVSFIWLSAKKFEWTIYLTIFLLPLYFLKIKLFFVPLSVLEILIWLLFIVWLMQRRYKKIKLEQIKDIVLPCLLILIGIIISVLLSDNLRVSAGILKGWVVAPMIFALMVSSEIKTEMKTKKIFWAFVISVSAVSLVAIVYYFGGKLTFDGRLAAFFLSPNHLAMYLSPGFIIATALFSQAAKAGDKALLIAILAVSGLTLYLTFSYAAWLSVLITVVFWLMTQFLWGKDKRMKKFIVYSLVFMVLIVVLVFSQLNSEKLNNLLASNRSSWQSRLIIWQAAWEIIKDYPVFGIGPGMFQEYYLRYQSRFTLPYLEWAVPQPHNLLLAFWLQSGFLGLGSFIWLLIVFFRRTYKEIKNKNQLALILFMLTGYTVLHGLVDTTYWKNDLAVIFWLTIALAVSYSNSNLTLYSSPSLRLTKKR